MAGFDSRRRTRQPAGLPEQETIMLPYLTVAAIYLGPCVGLLAFDWTVRKAIPC